MCLNPDRGISEIVFWIMLSASAFEPGNTRAGAMLQLTIDDNGDGFDLAEKLGTPSKYGSLGIPSMRERLSMIGGTLEIESSEGVGTTVFARIPIEPEEALP